MVTVYELTYILVSAILVYRAIHNLVIFSKNRRLDFLLFFALTQAAFTAYLICLLKTINTNESQALLFERIENAILPFIAVFFLFFAQRFRPILPDWFVWVFTIADAMLSLIILFYPHAYNSELGAVKTFPALGVTFYETKQPVWVFMFIALNLIGMAGIIVRYLQLGLFRQIESRILVVSLVLFFLMGANDMAVSLEFYTFPYIAHFGFVLVMFAVESLFTFEVKFAYSHAGEAATENNNPPATDDRPDWKKNAEMREEARKERERLREPPEDPDSAEERPLYVRVLGSLEVRLNGVKIAAEELGGKKKLLTLLKILLVRYGKGIHREELLELLWPDLTEANALNNLHALIFRLRKVLTVSEAVAFISDTVSLDPSLVSTDAARLDERIAESLASLSSHPERAIILMEKATELYRGDYFEFDPNFEGTQMIRDQIATRFKKSLLKVCSEITKENQSGSLIHFAEKCISLDNLDEECWRQLLRGLALAGKKNEARRKYDQLKTLLQKELSVLPDAQTDDLMRRIGS